MSETQLLPAAHSGMAEMREQMEMAKVIAASDILPGNYRGKPANVLIALRRAAVLEIDPFFFMENTAVINGKLVMHSDGPLAVVRSRAGDLLEHFDERWDNESQTAICRAKRRGHPMIEREFSMADAKTAGLLGKSGPWSQYPKRMCQMRARSYALRDGFSDYLGGLRQAEEVEGEEIQPAEWSEQPRPKQGDALRAAVAQQDAPVIAEEPVAEQGDGFAEQAEEIVETVAEIFEAEGEERAEKVQQAQSLFDGDEDHERQPRREQASPVSDYPAGMRTKPATAEARKSVDDEREQLLQDVLRRTKELHPELDGRAYRGFYSELVGRQITKRDELSVADLQQILAAFEEAER